MLGARRGYVIQRPRVRWNAGVCVEVESRGGCSLVESGKLFDWAQVGEAAKRKRLRRSVRTGGRAGPGGQEPYPAAQRLKFSRAIDSLSELARGEVTDLPGARVRLRDAARSFRPFHCSGTKDALSKIEGDNWRDRARVNFGRARRRESRDSLTFRFDDREMTTVKRE